MATLLDFRRRIRSVKNTQQITRAMKFVAAARLRRAQEAAIGFARKLREQEFTGPIRHSRIFRLRTGFDGHACANETSGSTAYSSKYKSWKLNSNAWRITRS